MYKFGKLLLKEFFCDIIIKTRWVGVFLYRFEKRADIELDCVLYRSNIDKRFFQPCRPTSSFIYYINGGHLFDFGTYKIECKETDIVYLPQGYSYTNYSLSDNSEYYQINFNIYDNGKPVAIFDKLTVLQNNNTTKYFSLFSDTHNYYVKRNSAYVPLCISNILKLISIFSSEEIVKRNKGNGINTIANTLTYIGEFYNLNTSITELAKLSTTSVSNLEKIFKQCFELSPSAYRNKIRIEHAKQLLAGGFSIEETAYLTGFSDRYYFSKIFKKFEGMSPSEFMRSY